MRYNENVIIITWGFRGRPIQRRHFGLQGSKRKLPWQPNCGQNRKKYCKNGHNFSCMQRILASSLKLTARCPVSGCWASCFIFNYYILTQHTTTLRHFRYLVCSVVNSAVTTYNAALNRPAYQSSVYRNFGAHLSNDGSHETDAKRDNIPRCSASENETNPWWAVDLGHQTEVYSVNFTNRRDCCGMKTYKFISRICLLYRRIYTADHKKKPTLLFCL